MGVKFYHIHQLICNRKNLFIVILLLYLLFMGLLSFPLKLEEDITKLVPQTAQSAQLNKVLKHADFADKIVIRISSVNDEVNVEPVLAYARELTGLLQDKCGPYMDELIAEFKESDIEYTGNFVADHLPLFLSEDDYRRLTKLIDADGIKKMVHDHYKILISPGGLVAKQRIREDPFNLVATPLMALRHLRFESNLGLYEGFLMTEDQKNLLMFIRPALPTNETDKNGLFVDKLMDISTQLNQKYEGAVSSEYYGSTIIAVANANQIKSDIKSTVSLALCFLLFILIVFYRKIWTPVLLFVPTLMGGLTGLFIVQLFRPTVSAISLGIGSVLLGITLDYSLHILTHYRNNRDVKKLYKDVTMPVLMSSVTTAIAFLCLTFLNSQALQDLGMFASISVLSSSVFALIIIPFVLGQQPDNDKIVRNLIDRFSHFSFDKSKWLIGLVIFIVAMSLFRFHQVRFNKDLNSMNYQSEAILAAGSHLDSILQLSSKSVYVVAYGNDLDQVISVNHQVFKRLINLEEDDKIVHFTSNGGLLIPDSIQVDRMKQWDGFWSDSLVNTIKKTIIKQGERVGFSASTYDPFFSKLAKKYKSLDFEDYRELHSFVVKDFIQQGEDILLAVNMVKLDYASQVELRDVFKDLSNVVIIDRKEISEAYLGSLKNDFSSLINYSFIAIVVLLLLFFRNLELSLVTLLPLVLTWVITLGIMGWLGIEFTIFNVIISTFIFGLGVDYSIFMTHALVKDYSYGIKGIMTYRTSIMLSVITTLLGVGVLIFAKHPALKSISVVSLIGINMTWLTVFVVQPLAFRFIVNNRVKRGFSPIRLRQFVFSFLLTLYYSVGGMLLSLIGLFILPLVPLSKKKKFTFLHNISALLVQSVLYLNPFVTKKVVNKHREDFKKPAIIISNHSSALDTLTMGLLTPRLIYLVNDWVYKSPVFGILARVMGFYPVSQGVEGSYDHLKEKVRQGYSLVVFPEGKRSETNRVGRFHKGAFYLQEQLKLDILPVYLHGNSEVMPKNDFIIHDGVMTIVVGSRIGFDDERFGRGYKIRNKKISKYYKEEFQKIRKEIEGDDYYKQILFSNYQMKEAEILKEVKKNFETNKSFYKSINEFLPLKMKLAHITDNYGELDVLLTSRSLDRKIHVLNTNQLRRRIEKNCYTLSRRKVHVLDTYGDFGNLRFDFLLVSKTLEDQEKLSIKSIDTEIIMLEDKEFSASLIRDGLFRPHSSWSNFQLLKKVKREKEI